MGPSCVVLFCKNKGNEAVPGITYFRLTPSRFDSWATALRRDPAERLSKHNRICSEHFSPEDMVRIKDKLKLVPGAIPKLKMGKRTLIDHNECSATATSPFEFIDVRINQNDSDADGERLRMFLDEKNGIKTEIDETPVNITKIEIDETATYSFSGASQQQEDHDNGYSSCDSEGYRGTPKKIRKQVKTFHNYCVCPKRVSIKLAASTKRNQVLRERYRVSKNKMSRLQRQVKSLKLIIQDLKKKKLLQS